MPLSTCVAETRKQIQEVFGTFPFKYMVPSYSLTLILPVLSALHRSTDTENEMA